MRNTRWISLLGRKALRVVLAGGLSFCGWGCHQHYYYYGNPPGTVAGCPPGSTVMPSTVTTTGPLCEVPGDGTTASSNSQRSTTVSDGQELARGGEHTVKQQPVAVWLETIRS